MSWNSGLISFKDVKFFHRHREAQGRNRNPKKNRPSQSRRSNLVIALTMFVSPPRLLIAIAIQRPRDHNEQVQCPSQSRAPSSRSQWRVYTCTRFLHQLVHQVQKFFNEVLKICFKICARKWTMLPYQIRHSGLNRDVETSIRDRLNKKGIPRPTLFSP